MSPDPRAQRAPVAALVLAAGRSSRFGSPKQVARLEGRTLLEHVCAGARAAGLRPVIAVVPPWLEPWESADEALQLVRNPDPDRGMSHSLRLGLAAVPADATAVVVLLGDQPTLRPAIIIALLAARGDRPVVAAFADGHAAPPVLLEREAFFLADRVSGDIGLRDLIASRPDLVRRVRVAHHPPDLDRPADLAALARRHDG